jgi:hypothetical protein
MPERTVELDLVFRALSDGTRRQVVERLVAGSASTSELAKPFAMALPSFTQHLDVLEGAAPAATYTALGARSLHVALAVHGVADGWLAEQRRLWESRLNQLDDLLRTLATTPDPTNPDPTNPNQLEQP